MSKEMFISSSPHETRVAVCEDDQLVELFLERDTDVGLVGGIYKGRVNRVLPGMQSAFVNIGLERDAFLYVSDFLMQGEEFEGIFDDEQTRVVTVEESRPLTDAPAKVSAEVEAGSTDAREQVSAVHERAPAQPAAPPAAGESALPPAPADSAQRSPAAGDDGEQGFQRHGRRGRRRRRGGGRFSERKLTPRREPEDRPEQPERTSSGFEVLPGESLAKYGHVSAGTEPREVRPSVSDVPEAPSEAASQTDEHEGTASSQSEFSRSSPANQAGATGIKEKPARSESSLRSRPVDEFAPPDRTFRDYSPEPTALKGSEPESVSTAAVPEPEEADPQGAEMPDESSPETSDELHPAPEEVFPEGVSQETLETAPDQTERAPGGEPGSEGAESGERQYTLRDQHTRPHFAPRRRHRGRRGMRRGRKRDGYRDSSRSANSQPVKISELLKEGQEILVQIAKEPLGTKGARITSHVALPGRYLVYMPTISHIGVSRRISSEQERLRLRNVILEHRGSLTGGFIVRTAAEGRSEEELKVDLKFLTTLWTDIRAKAERSKAPALIYRDLDLVQRILRDTLTPDFKSVRVDNEIDYERVVEFISRTQPALLPNVKLHTRETPLFEEYGIQAELEKALRPKVWLKSGGYIVINQTEALVAIDVNTGKYVGKTNRLEDTILKTNIDAVKEIVRQLRLRDLGGIIVVDFIDMDERRNRNRVVQAMEEALRHDRAPTKVLAFNEFGLVALTRKRVKQSLQRTLCEPCEYCTGSGWVKSVTTVCNEILAEARKIARQIDGRTITLRVHPVVARELKSKEGLLVSEIESAVRKDVVIKSDPTVHQERFEIF
jgi:ribonuclease G